VKKTSRREFLLTGAAAVVFSAALFRAAQGWMKDAGQMLGFGLTRPLEGPLTPPSDAAIDPSAHTLSRLTFGPVPGDYARISAMGVDAFIEEQLAPESVEDSLCDRAVARFRDVWGEPIVEHYDEEEEILAPILRRLTTLRAVYSRRQLFEVMCEFWSDHFNIDHGKGDCRWSKPHDDVDVIRAHALGNFRDMLRASALSPAMLWYLDGQANALKKPGDKPNENYARELMELHTLGVHGGYSQDDVMEVARCLTGWTVRSKKEARITAQVANPKEAAKTVGNFLSDCFNGEIPKLRKGNHPAGNKSPVSMPGDVQFVKEAHDDAAKRVLGHEIPAGLGAGDIDRVIEIVATHPSTARYVAKKLCTRFIADEPPAAAVDTVARAFADSKGDIKTTLRALFATSEFRASAGGKIKRPFHFVVSALRVTNAHTDADKSVLSFLEKMGQAPFRYPTPDGYPLEAAHWHATLLWRWKFALALANNEIKGTRIERIKLQREIGNDVALMATVFNRQPNQTETDAFLKSGDGLALLLAAPAFQRC
jgi:uncharacterized protein (DUF1800 family)